MPEMLSPVTVEDLRTAWRMIWPHMKTISFVPAGSGVGLKAVAGGQSPEPSPALRAALERCQIVGIMLKLGAPLEWLHNDELIEPVLRAAAVFPFEDRNIDSAAFAEAVREERKKC